MGTLVISHPGSLVLATFVAEVAALVLRIRRSAPSGDTRHAVRLLRALVVPVLLLGCAALLAGWDSVDAPGLLLAVAMVAGLRLVLEFARWSAGALSPSPRLLLGLLRLCAWAIVLVLVGRPACEREQYVWRKPLLVVLLDQSESLALADAEQPSRVERVRAAVEQAADVRNRVRELFDVQPLGFGVKVEQQADWSVQPHARTTALAAALQRAAAARSSRGEPPAAVLVISDGAENAADATSVIDAADELRNRGISLIAAGVGPPPGATPIVELDPLVVPGRVGWRDQLAVDVRARIHGCVGRAIEVALLWNGVPTDSRSVKIDAAVQSITEQLDTTPPGRGVHRLTARVTVPAEPAPARFDVSTMVAVDAEHLRVLYLDRVPRSESAFIFRALQADELIKITRQFLFDGGFVELDLRPEYWSGFDAIVLGDVPLTQMPPMLFESLVTAVREQGTGLLLAGGTTMFAQREVAQTALATVSPAALGQTLAAEPDRMQVVPRSTARQHPVLRGVDEVLSSLSDHSPPPDVWAELPPIPVIPLDAVQPLVTAILADARGRPVLVAHEIGRGRCAATGCVETWPWALASAAGRSLHEHFWRQLIVWLANRRPEAWVLSDRQRYVESVLESGGDGIRIRAGIGGVEPVVADSLKPTLTVQRLPDDGAEPNVAAPRIPVAVTRIGEEWQAKYPSADAPPLTPGAYELRFVAQPTGMSTHAALRGETLVARNRFEVVAAGRELLPPTADLRLLRQAAAQTAEVGGAYHPIEELPTALERLTVEDRRTRAQRRHRYELTADDPWGVVVWLVICLGLEWAVRKRVGLG